MYRAAPTWTGRANIPNAYALFCGDLLSLPCGVRIDVPSPGAPKPYRVRRFRPEGEARPLGEVWWTHWDNFSTYAQALARAKEIVDIYRAIPTPSEN